MRAQAAALAVIYNTTKLSVFDSSHSSVVEWFLFFVISLTCHHLTCISYLALFFVAPLKLSGISTLVSLSFIVITSFRYFTIQVVSRISLWACSKAEHQRGACSEALTLASKFQKLNSHWTVISAGGLVGGWELPMHSHTIKCVILFLNELLNL